ncbi:Protein RMD5-like protein A [Sciurus carolinensis]|uniref:Protein RMD5-like protein A n=1 Tax=Sciurus carolinensis TaxID=30640 RepID=A0AA41T8G2_SCICA|nr:Protein RMD5-like protein A [Sciurus carolinensis]
MAWLGTGWRPTNMHQGLSLESLTWCSREDLVGGGGSRKTKQWRLRGAERCCEQGQDVTKGPGDMGRARGAPPAPWLALRLRAGSPGRAREPRDLPPLTPPGMEQCVTVERELEKCCKTIKDTVQKLTSDHKDIHSSVSRGGKAIDKNFDSDISSVGIHSYWQADSQRLLNEVIVEHLFLQGMLDVTKKLCPESGLSVDPSQKEPFVELN